ncbi:MAG: type II toxin-antitoxin system HicA family toxin [Nitrospirae bacterium]|nr:type II toxin-antitoxin system HicA family toxin [Nitrospirota bacterium]
MPKLPVVSSKQIIRILQQKGFQNAPKRGKGSHLAFVKKDADRTRLVIVPDRKEIPKGDACNIGTGWPDQR